MIDKPNRNDYHPAVLDIKFYLINSETGDILKNIDGTEKEFQLKNSIRFKPLEYLCENLDVNMLEEIKETPLNENTQDLMREFVKNNSKDKLKELIKEFYKK